MSYLNKDDKILKYFARTDVVILICPMECGQTVFLVPGHALGFLITLSISYIKIVFSYLSVLAFSFFSILKLLKEIARKRRSIRLEREVELKPYIAAHFEVLPTEFTLGDKKHYGGFENKQLQSGQEYVFFVLAVMEHSESVS